jgi:predicted dithiol-disulfide oxidoreductase (DUF899 family)
MDLPQIVSEEEWQRANDELVAKDKELTRAADALAAELRRAPMMEFGTDFRFQGPHGEVGLLDLFDGRTQLVLYHAWFPESDDDMCTGCAMVGDQIPELAHLNARDTTLVFVSRSNQEKIAAMKRRLGWEGLPWYTDDESFQKACDTTEWFRLDVYLRDGDKVYLTHTTRGRGVEKMGTIWSFLDLTPFGRQEEWEDTPGDRPQTPPYQWWRKHDSYEESVVGAGD